MIIVRPHCKSQVSRVKSSIVFITRVSILDKCGFGSSEAIIAAAAVSTARDHPIDWQRVCNHIHGEAGHYLKQVKK
jgi:hypothetical protein